MNGCPIKADLSSFGLYSLEFRGMRDDLIQTYKILQGIDREHVEMFSQVGKSQTVHNCKISDCSFQTEVPRSLAFSPTEGGGD